MPDSDEISPEVRHLTRAMGPNDDLGIPAAMVQDLVLRLSLLEGRTSTLRLSEKLAISPGQMTKFVEVLRDLKHIEVTGIEGRNYLMTLTEAGRVQAMERMQLCRYTGAAPVSLAAYTEVTRLQHFDPEYDLESLRRVFDDLVVSDKLLGKVGPAAMGRGAMFLYGPPGTGKTSIAERLQRVHDTPVLIPYSVEVDSQVITVFDPVLHRRVEEQPTDIDPRWVLCHRPFITVGGELTGDMLDLVYQASSGTYQAPLQMQANNGIFVIDDFGRQQLRPDELLNRWIVPLDRNVDYLSLDYGMKFEVPFDSKIVFSTNLRPETLGDEAFFRRIQSKVLIPPITDAAFEEVLERVAKKKGVQLTPDAPTHLRWMSRELGDGDLRPYLPGAVCEILETICSFEGRPLVLDPPIIERIAEMYFTKVEQASAQEEGMLGPGGTGAQPAYEPPPPESPYAAEMARSTSIFAAPEEKPAASAIGQRDLSALAAKALARERGDLPTDESGVDQDDAGEQVGDADGKPDDVGEPDHEATAVTGRVEVTEYSDASPLCPSCGADVASGVKFCRECGTKLDEDLAVTSP